MNSTLINNYCCLKKSKKPNHQIGKHNNEFNIDIWINCTFEERFKEPMIVFMCIGILFNVNIWI